MSPLIGWRWGAGKIINVDSKCLRKLLKAREVFVGGCGGCEWQVLCGWWRGWVTGQNNLRELNALCAQRLHGSERKVVWGAKKANAFHLGGPLCRRRLVCRGCVGRGVVIGIVIGNKGKGGGVDTVTQSAGGGAVIKDMAQMGITLGAAGLGAQHAMAVVGDSAERRFGRWRPKAGPAAAAVELLRGIEERRATAHTVICARGLVGIIFPTKRGLRAALPSDAKLLLGEFFLPFCIIIHGLIPCKYPAI